MKVVQEKEVKTFADENGETYDHAEYLPDLWLQDYTGKMICEIFLMSSYEGDEGMFGAGYIPLLDRYPHIRQTDMDPALALEDLWIKA